MKTGGTVQEHELDLKAVFGCFVFVGSRVFDGRGCAGAEAATFYVRIRRKFPTSQEVQKVLEELKPDGDLTPVETKAVAN